MRFVTLAMLIMLFGSGSTGYADILRLTTRAVDYLMVPERPVDAITGSEFVRATAHMTLKDREEAVERQVKNGNVPNFLRNLVPVHVESYSSKLQRTMRATFYVTPDYLAVGSDSDYLRIPVNLYTARALANNLGFGLPTKRMVDAIYEQAKHQLRPEPMKPTRQMMTNAYFELHDAKIDGQFAGDEDRGLLTAGHKKDVVMSNILLAKSDAIAIYGWHRQGQHAIQPLSTAHGARYVDYSHGIRFVSRLVLVEGRPMDIADVLADANLSSLLSDEGIITKYDEMMGLHAAPHATTTAAISEP